MIPGSTLACFGTILILYRFTLSPFTLEETPSQFAQNSLHGLTRLNQFRISAIRMS
jgi:hypothetical protein